MKSHILNEEKLEHLSHLLEGNVDHIPEKPEVSRIMVTKSPSHIELNVGYLC